MICSEPPSFNFVESQNNFPEYWEKACEHLSARDRVMRRLIAQQPKMCLVSKNKPFSTLARTIVGQRISTNSAQAIWERLLSTFSNESAELTPESILNASFEELKSVGLPLRKIEYLQNLALHFSQDALNYKEWKQMGDEEVVQELLKVKGVGRWTAEMFLIFSLLRPNVLPLDDVGLMNGISHNYFSGEPVSRAEARDISEAWLPYRTVAIWYIWQSMGLLPVSY